MMGEGVRLHLGAVLARRVRVRIGAHRDAGGGANDASAGQHGRHDREKDGEGWGITDGSAGLKGRIIKSDDLSEIKLFAATFLSGAAGVLTDRENTILGSQMSPTLRNVPIKGAQEVLAAYAKQIYESIQRDGFYVRVPAGKQFYLYVTQTIDQNDATLGGTRLTEAAPVTNQTMVARSVPAADTTTVQPGIAP